MSDTSKPRDKAQDPRVGSVTVRYWAAARTAAGRESDQATAGTLADVMAEVQQLHPGNDRFERVVAMCSILVGEQPVGAMVHASIDVAPGTTVELLPPFAGGEA